MEWYFRSRSRLPATVMMYRLEPGASEGDHFHAGGRDGSCTTESVEELYVVTDGEVTITVDGCRSVLHAGDAMYAPAGVVHGVSNESERSASVILVFGPESAT